MPIKNKSEWIWFSGEWVPWDEAQVHVTVHALHYGTSVFEGIRAYETPDGAAIFRLNDHMKRFMFSCKVMRFMDQFPTDLAGLNEAAIELVARNHQKSCYIRPLAFRDSDYMGLNAAGQKVEVIMFSINFGRYLGVDAIEKGVDVAISSWRRVASSPMVKAGGQYVNNQQISMEARRNGYSEGIALDPQGNLSEGAGENIFLVMNDILYTPPLGDSILSGITRDSVVQLAKDLSIPVQEMTLSREMLYLADEVFMTGTAAEITPIKSVDQLPVGNGVRGPITQAIQESFFEIVEGRTSDRHQWLTLVPEQQPAAGD
jgi:branched-chain amino acid aminotransferase